MIGENALMLFGGGTRMLQNIKDISITLVALSVSVLSIVLIVAVIGLYPDISDTVSNLSDASATLNRALNDAETAVEGLIELNNAALDALK